jgi:hypothetical protein
MIWQFGEMGYDISIDAGGRTTEKPIKWDYLLDTDRHRLFLIYKLLNNLRETQPVFGTSNYSYSLSNPLKSIQLIHSTMKVNVLGNFGVTLSSINPTFPQAGKWYEYFTGDSITVAGVNDPINLQPGEYRLYTTKKLASPKFVLGIEDHKLDEKEHLVIIYPNPSSCVFNIEIKSPYTASAFVTLYDITGKLIRLLKTNLSGNGYQTVIWDGRSSTGSPAPAGIYVVKVFTGLRSETLKIIKE